VSAARFNSRAKAQSAADEIMDGLKMPASVIGNRPYRVEVSGSVNGERQTYTLGQDGRLYTRDGKVVAA
jgi:hypothetical protein